MKTPNRILIGISLFMLCLVNPSIAQTEITFYTSEGDFVVEMYDALQPITAGNIIKLVNEKFYDGVIFHRVIDNFVIQGGDPTGTGSGGPGYSIQDEFHPSLSNVQKTLSMANSGPNTGGSQFFVNLVNNTFLDYNKPPLTSKHPVFGIVKSGFNIVQNIGKVSVDGSDRPLVDVVMDSVRVTLNPFVGIQELKNDRRMRIYPNPVTENSLLTFQSSLDSPVHITIYNGQGQKVSVLETASLNGKNTFNVGNELWTGNYENGIYFIVLDQLGTITTTRLVLMR